MRIMRAQPEGADGGSAAPAGAPATKRPATSGEAADGLHETAADPAPTSQVQAQDAYAEYARPGIKTSISIVKLDNLGRAHPPARRPRCSSRVRGIPPGGHSYFTGALPARRLASPSANLRASCRWWSWRLVGGILIPRYFSRYSPDPR